MNSLTVVEPLAALAHPVRLHAPLALMLARGDGTAQKALVDVIGIGPTNPAFHLEVVAAEGPVTQAQAGRFVIYRAADGYMNRLLTYLTDNCCQGLEKGRPVATYGSCAC